ncbi:UNVERIFIED_CONTAM: Receptor-like serine/threonine-protein kinase [Sesamum radiatum]|uniref:Receptor-like serine/threonine-protein kinase n=1 Tax=Sesamum radiatum TaxID=300843 RepID=A0AAW2VA10_SESRA
MPPPPAPLHHRHVRLLPPLLAAAVALAFFLLSVIFYRKITRKRTVPTDLKPPFPPQRFSFSLLRRATDSFSAANRLGQGGFGSVYKGVLPSGQEIAVKLMSEASIQGEREFHNELSLASSIDTICCPYVVCVLGFSTSDGKKDFRFRYYGRRKKRRGRRCCPEGMRGCGHLWKRREEKIEKKGDDYGSIIEENESVETEDAVVVNVEQSPESYCVRIIDEEEGLGAVEASPSEPLEKEGSASEVILDRISVDSGNRKGTVGRGKSESGGLVVEARKYERIV